MNPLAVSPVGAVGLLQFMPGTWSDMQRQLGWRNVDPRSPQHAIVAGAFYMRQLRNMWRRDRSPTERQALALPSYNSGAGNILKAQAQCNGARFWDDIKPCLILITGTKNARETIGYGVSIAKWRGMLE